MSFINHAAKEIICKIAYCGTGLSGKTTNVQHIYESTQHEAGSQSGRLVPLSTENERTLFFDFLPLSVAEINGYKARFHLYTIPGQTFYDMSREFILKGVDGIVFVVDSEFDRMEANLEAFHQLERSLERQGYDLHQLPVVFQYNKRDLPGAVPVEELEVTFNPMKRPSFEAVASQGKGVMETLRKISQMVIDDIRGGRA